MLKLKSPLSYNQNVQKACLPDPGFSPVNENCFVSGWGTLQSGAYGLPDKLQWVSVPIVSNRKCNQAYGNQITQSMVCAGYPQGGKR